MSQNETDREQWAQFMGIERLPGHNSTKLWYNANSVSVNLSSAILLAVSKMYATNFISEQSDV